jgi:hypothetical protein
MELQYHKVSESSATIKSCVLEGTLGVPEGHPTAAKRLDLKRSRGGFSLLFVRR